MGIILYFTLECIHEILKGYEYFMTIPYNQSGFYTYENYICFSPKVNNTKLSFDIGKNYGSIKQAEIYNSEPFRAKGDFCVSVVYEITETHDSKFFEIKTSALDQYWQPKLDSIKSRIDHCKGQKKGSKKSKRYLKFREIYRKMEKKKFNQLKDFHRKLSRKMVDNTKANTLIAGYLEAKEFAQSKNQKRKRKRSQNKSSQNQDHLFRFIGFLAYKCELVGKCLIKIDESYASKECYVCETRHEMTPWEHTINCDCRNVVDRDRNSSEYHEMFPITECFVDKLSIFC
jgi:putative transposase